MSYETIACPVCGKRMRVKRIVVARNYLHKPIPYYVFSCTGCFLETIPFKKVADLMRFVNNRRLRLWPI